MLGLSWPTRFCFLLGCCVGLQAPFASAAKSCDCTATSKTCTAVVSCDGTLPASMITDLPALTSINIVDGSRLWGTLPFSLVNATKLANITIRDVLLSGTLPKSLGSLSTLRQLSFSGIPCLTGTIPPSLGSVSPLTHIVFDEVALSGSLPPSLGSLESLGELFVTTAPYITGTLPQSFSSLESLHLLWLAQVPHLSGSFPKSIGSLRNLQYLTLDAVQLTGSIPSSMGSLSSLNFLPFYNTPLTGPLPRSIGSLAALKMLVLDNLQIDGTLPNSLGSLRALTTLNVHSLELTGSIPRSIGSLESVVQVYLVDLPLSGQLPGTLEKLQHLTDLFLDNLQLSGTLPSSLGQPIFIRLTGSESLQGSIPPALLPNIGTFYGRELTLLDLGDNQLTGSFSAVCGSWYHQADLSVSTLNISGNALTWLNLTGWVSCSNGQAVGLRELDLHNNPNMAGTLPTPLNSFASLTYLDASECALGGSIPALRLGAAGDFLPPLEVIDLSGNQLTGSLPEDIGELTTLHTFDISDNALDPTMPVSICSLLQSGNLTTCDVSLQASTMQSRALSASNAAGKGWDCSTLPRECAVQLQVLCGAGDRCFNTSRPVNPDVFIAVIVLVGLVVLGIPVVVVLVVRNRRAKALLLQSLTQRRAATVELLQCFVDDEDVLDVMLPPDSVDFGPHSQCIASGGGGSVYQCTLTLAATRLTEVVEAVALKEIHAMQDLVAIEAGAEEFAKELAVLMKLRHENIVSFYGIYQHFDIRGSDIQDRYFLVTQFADHGSLERYIVEPFGDDGDGGDSVGPSLTRRFLWVRQIAEAVHYLHREGFVHRDLKPQNILLHGDEWRCLLTDFGIARSLSSDRTLTSKIGTAQFMPPEALSGLADTPQDAEIPKPATLELAKAWDTYSFGCMVACIFNRTEIPYPDLDERVVMVKVLLSNLRPPLPSSLGSAVCALLQRMWRAEPAERPAMAEILDAIDAATSNELGPFSSKGIES